VGVDPVQATLDVRSDLFAFSKVADTCTRTQEYELLPLTFAPYFCIDVVRSGT
jgi:hypothetical protein